MPKDLICDTYPHKKNPLFFRCVPWHEKISCVAVLSTPPPGQPHAVFGWFFSLSGGWILICKEFIMAEDSPHITISACSLGVHAGVSVLWHSPSLGVLAGASVLWHSPSLGVLAGVSVLWHSPSLGVFAGVSMLWHGLGFFAGVRRMWHSPNLDVLAGVRLMWHSPSLGVLAAACFDTARTHDIP